MGAFGPSEIAIIAGLVLVLGLFWGVVAFVGWTFWRRRPGHPSSSPSSRQPDAPATTSTDVDRSNDQGLDDGR